MSTKIIEFRQIYVNRNTGLCTWELQDMGYLKLLSDIVREEGWGENIVSIARKGRINAKGKFTFHSGCGYDVVDMDLLDGDGTGKRSSTLNDKYDVSIWQIQ